MIVALSSCEQIIPHNVYCGMDDGPFSADQISIPFDSIGTDSFEIDNGKLFVQNELIYSYPVISLIEDNNIAWSLLLKPDQKYEYQDYDVGDMTITEIKRANNNSIVIRFYCWGVSGDGGTMKIDRKTGENNYCTSW